jgi:CheY-like chemotaxis protein
MVRITDKPITFKLDINEDLPVILFGDDLRIKQILNNLLSNAFKYTREGTVTLGAVVGSTATDGAMFRPEGVPENESQSDASAPDSPLPPLHPSVWTYFYISDTGIGIREEDIKKLFVDYNQVDTQTNRKIEGTGLGLSITKKFVEMMGGTILVESEYGKGTTFRVQIRQGIVTDETIGKEIAEKLRSFRYSDKTKKSYERLMRPDLSYARVLVVDDFPTNLDVAAGMMRKYRMQVDCVLSGQDAVERITAGVPVYNAVFMDHMMPGMDGLEAVTMIRALGTDYAKNIPVIALTANAVTGNEKMFLDNGFNAFLSKPFNAMSLDAIVQRWVRNKSRE